MNTVIFDLDGVLLDFCEVHYEALNQAIEEIIGASFIITREQHETIYNGRSTRDKLYRLGVNSDLTERVYLRKQELTQIAIANIRPDQRLIELMIQLKTAGFKIACASNSIKSTIVVALDKLGILSYFDLILSNEDVSNPKPDPEIYIRTMDKINALPTRTIIFEDSWIGIQAATKSGAWCQQVNRPEQLTPEFVLESIGRCSHL
jgi:beta-phosphoglucomutase